MRERGGWGGGFVVGVCVGKISVPEAKKEKQEEHVVLSWSSSFATLPWLWPTEKKFPLLRTSPLQCRSDVHFFCR